MELRNTLSSDKLLPISEMSSSTTDSVAVQPHEPLIQPKSQELLTQQPARITQQGKPKNLSKKYEQTES